MQCVARMTQPILDSAFTSALLEVGHLHNDINFAEWCRQIRVVDAAVTRLCDAIDFPDKGGPPAHRLARDAYLAVLALAQVLYGAYSEDDRASTALELTQLAVAGLLEALEPYVPVTADQRR